MKILVVDDEEDVQLMFKQHFRHELRNQEIKFIFALNAKEAIKFLDELSPFDIFLVLSDINMPGMSGLEMIQVIKETWPDLDIVMITAYANQENMEKSKQFGAREFLAKPLDFGLLRNILNLPKKTVNQ
jgi:CheY-like chemotaxis protein